eukprot:Rhum_TRINITY_DN15101_c8_g1::Rhum_TRINITY_DN15101_c8_g1_i1::g.139358::m.139358/K07198/PRKAA, AMPK; 5'-AMP-activated protein kinase, catalytic alpha subunit
MGDRAAGSAPSPKGKTVGRYLLVSVLGKGTNAKVFKGVCEGEEYAVKRIKKKSDEKEAVIDTMHREIRLMKELVGNRFAIYLREALQTPNNLYLVTELATGSLADVLGKPEDGQAKITEEQSRSYFQDLICALWFCHAQKVAHRDIKPENLLFAKTGELKIADFGLSNIQQQDDSGGVTPSLRLTTVCGTPYYIAPEVFLTNEDSPGYNGFIADIWSAGVVLYQMLTGSVPFGGKLVRDVFESIMRTRPPKHPSVSPEAQSLLDVILVKDPTKRATLKEVTEHPWFVVDFRPELLQDSPCPILLRKAGYDPDVFLKERRLATA